VEAFGTFLEKVPAGDRFFAIVHMDTTHHPYWAPKGFRPFPGNKLIDRYENSLAYLDLNQGALLDILERRRLLDDTIIVFTSDHGEAFGEHGAYGHQQLFHEEGFRVPFWIYLPKALAERNRAALEASRHALHSNLDIVPTLVGLMGLAQVPEVAALLKELRGQDLVAPEAAGGQPVLVYNGYTATTSRKGFGLADGSFRILVRPDPFDEDRFHIEAYDLAQDPLETRNLWGEVSPERVQRWLDALQDFPRLHDEVADLIRLDATLAADQAR
jgi:arylsulfatase A-like enzyme